MNILRPTFNAACTRVGISPEHSAALWAALRGPVDASTSHISPRWSAPVQPLLDSIRRENANLQRHQRSRSIYRLYADVTITNPKTGRTIRVLDAYDAYVERFHAIEAYIKDVLQAYGHRYAGPTPPDGFESLESIIARERAGISVDGARCAPHPAGMKSWIQWEDPEVVRRTIALFEAARVAVNLDRAPGRVWVPYLPKGDAADSRLAQAWRHAFHEFVAHGCTGEAPAVRAFWEMVRDNVAIQSAITEAISVEMMAHRSPSNRRFKGRTVANEARTIWLALAQPVRLQLAAEYARAMAADGVKFGDNLFALLKGERLLVPTRALA